MKIVTLALIMLSILILGCSEKNKTTEVSPPVVQSIEWKEMASLPEGFYLGDAVSMRDEIYFVAGRNDVGRVSLLFKFSPDINQWTQLADIPDPAVNLALAEINGIIYAIGGDLFKDTTRRYTPDSDSWEIMEPMPTGRQHIDCGVYGNDIFVMGGLTSWDDITKKHEVYNVLTNSWKEIEAIPSWRNNAAVATLKNEIYVMGGAGTEDNVWGDIQSVESYNISTGVWEQKNDLPLMLFKPSSVVVNDQLFLLGGQAMINGVQDCSDKVFIYNEGEDNWIETTPLPAKNVFFGCCSIDEKIYVIGGTVGGNPNWDSYPTVYEGTVVYE